MVELLLLCARPLYEYGAGGGGGTRFRTLILVQNLNFHAENKDCEILDLGAGMLYRSSAIRRVFFLELARISAFAGLFGWVKCMANGLPFVLADRLIVSVEEGVDHPCCLIAARAT